MSLETSYEGTSPSTGGIVVQEVSATITTSASRVGTSFAAMTGHELSITPTDANNSIHVSISCGIGISVASNSEATIFRDTVDLTPSGQNGLIQGPSAVSTQPTWEIESGILQITDSPSTTSPVTYKVAAKASTGTVYIGRRGLDTSLDIPTIITLREVSPNKIVPTGEIVGGLGVGQTWQDVKASRAAGTTYTNSSGKTIFVAAALSATTVSTLVATIAGLSVKGTSVAVSGYVSGIQFPVPDGVSYSVTMNAGSPTISVWAELR